jgi:hypothetical protein
MTSQDDTARRDTSRPPRAVGPVGARLIDQETLNEEEAHAAAGIRRETAPAAVARGEVPGTEPAPGLPGHRRGGSPGTYAVRGV